MTTHHTATKLVAASLAAFAFAGTAISQEAPYLVGDFSASIDNVVRGLMPQTEAGAVDGAAERNETSTFAYTAETLQFPRPRSIEDAAAGNFSASIRESELRN